MVNTATPAGGLQSKPKKGKAVGVGPKKRKSGKKSGSSIAAAKKLQYKQVSAQSLPWKRVNAGYDFDDIEGDGGMLELEEIDDVDVVYEETPEGGKSIKFKIREDKLEEAQNGQEEDDDEEWAGFTVDDGAAEPVEGEVQDEQESPVASTSKLPETIDELPNQPKIDFEVPFDESTLPGFSHIPLLPSLKRALHSMKFEKPSEIQERALSSVLAAFTQTASVLPRDIVGVAETGSGKTLAYSLPILQEILKTSAASEERKRPLSALILCPTRELALQVRQHVGDVVYRASIPPEKVNNEDNEGQKKEKHAPRVNIVTICGGMSVQKQKRLLNSPYGVDIIVATPGRLWDMIQDQDDSLAKSIKGIKFLVLDEADRMIENGHFAELESIVNLTKRSKGKQNASASTANGSESQDKMFQDDFSSGKNSLDAVPVREDIRTYVFSATMSKELQRNVKKKGNKKRQLKDEELGKLGALGDLLDKLDFRDEDPLVIDLSRDGGLVASIQEIKVDCLLTEKDVYLYYFLLRYPGRTLVFLSSIDGIRRLQPLLNLMELNVAVLHSGMQQRARLKALDRFKSSQSMVMLATDVAARGLDVPEVEHVVHYQLPRTADTYIHRSGRTGRAGKQGVSLQLCAPEEKPVQKALMKSMNKEVSRIQELDVEWSLLTKLKERVELARQIEVAQHRVEKASHEENWLKQAAESMEIDFDEDNDSDGGRGLSKIKSRQAKGKEKELRARLKNMLAQSLMLRGISARYLTAGGSSDFADQMLKGSNHKTLLGLRQSRAVEDLKR